MKKQYLGTDLFGEDITKDPLLIEKYKVPPFSILDTKQGNWQNRKRLWKNLGLKSEEGRGDMLIYGKNVADINKYRVQEGKAKTSQVQGTSIFDPVLCEVLYHWFCPEKGSILDPFCGGSVRGIVAGHLDFRYTGIDLRIEQINANRAQVMHILKSEDKVFYLDGDSNEVLDTFPVLEKLAKKNKDFVRAFDFVFSCPPYHDLEIYSDDPADLSNMPYDKFMENYSSIIKKSCDLLKDNRFACFVVGEVRDDKSYYKGFVPDTIRAFEAAGLHYYNEIILVNQIASASMRADGNMKYAKVCKTHQNVLVFYKGSDFKKMWE
jgi:DNA modification methylase